MNLLKESKAIGRYLKRPQLMPRIPRDIVDFVQVKKELTKKGSKQGLGRYRAKGNGR
jgi:hypothetical protein